MDRPQRRGKAALCADAAGSWHFATIEVFTTRPDTLFGMSFVALAQNIRCRWRWAAARIRMRRRSSPLAARWAPARRGRDGGEARLSHRTVDVEHPFLPDRVVPVWIANFVLMEYGTGAVYGCPAHDQRDLDFARKLRRWTCCRWWYPDEGHRSGDIPDRHRRLIRAGALGQFRVS